MSLGDFISVADLRSEHGALWKEWQAWPVAMRPSSTGDLRADVVLSNPLLFEPTDRGRIIGVTLQCFYDVPQAVLPPEPPAAAGRRGDGALRLAQKVRIICDYRPVATEALFDEHLAPSPVVGVMDARELDPAADLLVSVVYDLAALLQETPWAPNGWHAVSDQ